MIARVSKAIAGGLAAATASAGTAYFGIPEGLPVPAYVYYAVPAVNFVVGFVIVYLSPANAP